MSYEILKQITSHVLQNKTLSDELLTETFGVIDLMEGKGHFPLYRLVTLGLVVVLIMHSKNIILYCPHQTSEPYSLLWFLFGFRMVLVTASILEKRHLILSPASKVG